MSEFFRILIEDPTSPQMLITMGVLGVISFFVLRKIVYANFDYNNNREIDKKDNNK